VKGSELLIAELEAQGVEVLFGYPGGAIMPVYDALVDSSMKHVLVRHEQGASLAANGYARVSGKVGVCMATSGPGATNLVTGIADAFMDSVPMVAITGQVPTPVMGTDAFQEVDIFGITLPVVKHSYIVRRIEDLARVVREAFRIASTGRPGPVLIDLPKDIANALVPDPRGGPDQNLSRNGVSALPQPPDRMLRQAEQMIRDAQRPVFYAGGGVALSGATAVFRRFVEQAAIPAVTTLHGVGNLPTGHPLLLGMMGMHGTRAANLAVQGSDLLICMGARFDDRATGKLDEFAPGAAVIHMDIDHAELGKLRRPNLSLHGDLAATVSRLQVPRADCDAWRGHCFAERDRNPLRYDAPGKGVYAPAFIREMTRRDPARWTITCDVGQHQMWVAQHAHFAGPEQHITSGGLGTMGFGIPAAIGAQFARPDANILAVTGDGSFMMNVQELATIRRYNLPIKIVVVDNSCLGLVRQWQECFFDGRYSEVDLSDNPDFTTLATAFGIPSMRVESAQEVDSAVSRIEESEGPLLVHLPIDVRANVWPLVPPAKSNSTMIEGVPSCNTGSA
jgi:acetolactate synthase-1/2/3 large subunit